MKKMNRSIRSLMLISAIVMLGMAAQASPRDLDWYRQTLPTGSGTQVWTLGGTSLDTFYMGLTASTSILKYDEGTNSWGAFAPWDTHYSGNSNWNATQTALVAANGNHLWVSSGLSTGGGYVAYYNGTTWSDIPTVTTAHYGIAVDPADGTKAGFAIGSGNLRIVNSDGTQVSTTTTLSTMQSISGSGDNWWAKGASTILYLARTTNGGTSWANTQNFSTAGGFTRVQGMHALDANRAAVSTGTNVFVTSDGGQNWARPGNAVTGIGTVRGVYIEDWDNSIWAFGTGALNGMNGVSHWNGTNWQTITLPTLPTGSTFNMSAFTKIGDHYWVGGYDSSGSEGAILFTTIPEPATLLLLGPAAALLLLRRRRRAR